MKRLYFLIAMMCLISAPAFGLSDAEYLKMKKDPKFAAADKELTQTYNAAKKIMSKSEFNELIRSQRDWIAKDRDVRAETFMEKGCSRVEAYTQATIERAKGIRARLEIIQNCVVDDIGDIDDAYFDNGNGVNMHLSLISRAEYWFEVSFTSKGVKISMYGHFDPNDNTIKLDNDNLKAVLTFKDIDTVNVKVNSVLNRAFNSNANGKYTRH